MTGPAEVVAWRPRVPGLTEVLHARFTDHAYPSHTHDAWTLLLVDDGAVRYDLDRHAHGAARFGVTPTHLVRAFTSRVGLPPHRYLTGRRIDLARRLLLDGVPAAEVATAAGFYDQAHLTRHFRRMLATTPAAYARSA